MSGKSGDGNGDDAGSPAEARRGHSAAEWTTLIISSLLIAAVAGAVLYFAVTGGDAPPAFTVTPDTAALREDGGSYALPVSVTNTGDLPAQEVTVRVTVTAGDASETSAFTLELVAAGATEEGTVVFSLDPAAGAVTAAVESFQ
ncbi:MAG: hypothetical protein QM692_14685 [Thermomicrobiales bacterium]